MNRRGFTFVEMLTVLVVLGILAGLAVLKYIDLTNEAIAARAGTEVHAVRLAALNYFAERETFPPDAAEAQVPPAMVPLLPTGMEFSHQRYTLDWDFVPGANGGGRASVTVRTQNARQMQTFARRLAKGSPYIMMGNELVYFILVPGGAM